MNKLPIFLSFLIIGIFIIGAVPISASSASTAPSAPSFSDQAADIEQNNVYTWISSLFTTGYTTTAAIPAGTGLIQYTPSLLASAASVAEIQILSMSGQVLSTAKGPGYYVSDTFNFSFSGNSEYEMLLYFNNATSGSNTIATTTNGVLGVSQDGYVYDYSTNTQSTGTVFTITSNITSSNLQATIYITEMGAKAPSSDATVHFISEGIPTGTLWTVSYHTVLNGYVSANATLSSTNSYINLTAAIGNVIYYWIGDPEYGLLPSPSEGIISLTGNMTVTVVFPSGMPSSYSITFIPAGLPSGTTWGVTIYGETLYDTNTNGQNPDIIFNEPDGTYPYSIYVMSPLIATPSSGSVEISGSSVSVTISILQPQVSYYTLSFTESGLPSGTDFTVSIGTAVDSGNPTASFTVPNGTYYYTIADVGSYVPSPASGSVSVNGASVTVSIEFSIPTYPITFTETGLPSGTTWSVTLAGSTQSSTGASIAFHETSGSYAYSVSSVSGYSVSPSFGTATVSGSGVSISVAYSQVVAEKYQVTFHEIGLPSGNWFVNVSGQSSSGPIPSSQGSYSVSLLNGSYSYSVSTGNKNYKPAYTNSFSVNGATATEYITFSLVTYTVTFTESGLSSGVRWGVTFNGTSFTSTSSSIEFTLIQAGTYSYTATASGYNTVSGTLTVTSSMTEQLTFTSSITITPPPSVKISSSQDYYVNGTLTAPPGYSLQQFSLVTVNASWNGSVKSFTLLPSANFSLQVPALNATYHLSFVLAGTNLRSEPFNITVIEKSATSVIGSYLPSSYSFYPATGSVVYSSETIGILLKGNVTYSGILVYASAYGISKNITLESKTFGNGTQSLYYGLNINNFSIGQYNFKYLIIYNGKVQTSLTAQYFIEAQNAITLKYVDAYSETPSGAYNVSFNISVVDNNSVKYSPLNLLNVSLGHRWWFLTGRTEIKNGTARDYFLLTIYNLSKGEYELNVTAYNRTGNVPYMMFSTNYNFTVPSLPPSITGGFSWQDAKNWLQQGYNEFYIAGIAVVLVIGAVYAYSTGSFTGSRITSSQGSSQNQEKPQGINIRINTSAPKAKKSKRRSK